MKLPMFIAAADIAASSILATAGSSPQTPFVGFAFGEKGLMADFSLEASKVNKIDR